MAEGRDRLAHQQRLDGCGPCYRDQQYQGEPKPFAVPPQIGQKAEQPLAIQFCH